MADRKAVVMNMTGDEFRQLVEGKDPNQVIETIPEILDFLHGIEDGETLEDYIKRIIRSIIVITEGEQGNTVTFKLD